MKQFYLKSGILPLLLGLDYLLYAVWTLGRRLAAMWMDGGAPQTAPSLLSAALFALAPLILYALSAKDSEDTAKTAFFAGAVSRFLAFAVYVLSSGSAKGADLLPLIIVLSLGAAILETACFGLCACAARPSRTEALCAAAAALACALEQAAYLVVLYTSLRMTRAGYAASLVKTLSAFSTAHLFAAIVKGVVCALFFVLVRIWRREHAADAGSELPEQD